MMRKVKAPWGLSRWVVGAVGSWFSVCEIEGTGCWGCLDGGWSFISAELKSFSCLAQSLGTGAPLFGPLLSSFPHSGFRVLDLAMPKCVLPCLGQRGVPEGLWGQPRVEGLWAYSPASCRAQPVAWRGPGLLGAPPPSSLGALLPVWSWEKPLGSCS